MQHDDLNSLNFGPRIKARFKNIEKLREEIQAGKSAQEILGVTKKEMSFLFQAARRLLEGGKYVDAANAFLFLATLCPKESDYWLNLGMALSKTEDLESAKDAFELATITGGDDPLPFLHLAKILFSLNEREATLEALDWTIQIAGQQEKYKDIKKEAQKAKRLFNKE